MEVHENGKEDGESRALQKREPPQKRYLRTDKRHKYEVEEMQEAIEESHGIIANAARRLGCSRQTVYAYMERFPEMRSVLEDAREAANDAVASSLYEEAIKPGGNIVAKLFWLKARAGWIETNRRINENVEVEKQVFVIGGKEIHFAWAAALFLSLALL